MLNFTPIICILNSDFFGEIILMCNALNIEFYYEDNTFFVKKEAELFFLENLNEYVKEKSDLFIEENFEKEVSIGIFSYFSILSIVVFFIFTKITNFPLWVNIGGNDAYLVVNGEFYRALTSLFLHNDIMHIFSNLLFFLLLLKTIIYFFNEGRAWFLVILSGFTGNIISDYIYQTNHISIGFSTSVFGAIGILSAIRKNRNKFIPIATGVALFAFTGIGKEVDMLAHFTGLVSGMLFAILYEKKHFKIFYLNDKLYKVLICLLIVFSWIAALYFKNF